MKKTILKLLCLALPMVLDLASCSNNDDPVIPTPTPETGYESVLTFFNQVNGVPRPSRHEEKMREFLIKFATERSLEYVEDHGNIIIYKAATNGMESAPSVCLQTHMDMVCVAADGYDIDFLTQGIEQEVEGDLIHSKGNKTSLGADDGIGVAMVLAVLDSKDVAHGPLECLFTWNEEGGEDGVYALTDGILKSSYLMNIDWEQEGELCIGTAGGQEVEITLAGAQEAVPTGYAALQLGISGVTGGHSGILITNGGANAITLLGGFLNNQDSSVKFQVSIMTGGTFSNVIALTAGCTVVVPETSKDAFQSAFTAYMEAAKTQYAATDPNMTYTVESVSLPASCLSVADTKTIVSGIATAPQGVIAWSQTVSGMFELSNNLGIVALTDGSFKANYFSRGFNDPGILATVESIEQAYEVGTSGAQSRRFGGYSPWTCDMDAKLFTYARSKYQSLFGKPIHLQIVGGGLELSQFAVVYPDMQFLSFGPTIHDAHTIHEAVEISTVDSCWKYLLALLKDIE